MAFPDDVTELPQFVDKDPALGVVGTKLDEAHLNPIVDHVNGLTSTLGVNPQGTYSTVVERLDDMENNAALWAILRRPQ